MLKQSFAALGAALVGLMGCATIGPDTADSSGGYSEYAAREVFDDAYHHVRDRYIEPVSVERIAMAGMSQIGTIDGALAVDMVGRNVQLASAGGLIDSWPRPSAYDTNGWARVTAEVLGESRRASHLIAEQDTESVYSTVFSGALEPLDGYSRYTDARSAEQARASREGFGGLGVTIRTDETGTHVLHVIPDTPAAQSGLKRDDIITHVDGTPITGIERFKVIQKLRGPIDSSVTLGVKREGAPGPLSFTIVRAHIVPPSILYERRGSFGYFRLTAFNRRTAYDLREAVTNATDTPPGIDGIILDLRGNPGGLLDQSVAAADLFITDGVLVSTRGRHPASNSTFAATTVEVASGLPMVVLINARSASASEMLAATLQDRGRAVVVGTVSHGKGSVQNVARMPNGGELIITWSRMIAPSGYVLDDLGVLPGICISAGLVDPTEQKQGGSADIKSLVADWHRYSEPDQELADTLRSYCPPSDDEPEIDVTLAERVLSNPTLYAKALRPVTRSPTRDRYRWNSASVH